MTFDAASQLTRLGAGVVLAFALMLGLGIALSSRPALAASSGGEAGLVLVKDNWNQKGDKGWNGNNWNKNWSNNNNNWNNNNWKKNGNKNWSKNNNWNKNWNNRAYVRGWYPRPYYGQFFGGVVLGSILAATGAGIVPLAPAPNLCWYWADPYMYRGYWDYCY
jgi:hypothetical protein